MEQNLRIKTIIVSILILLIGAAVLAGLLLLRQPPPEKSGELLQSLITQPLKKQTVTPEVAEFAVVTSLQAIDVKAQVSGKVVFCGEGTEDGVLVKKGEVLIRLEKDDYENTKQSARAALEILVTNEKQYARDVNDLKDMLDTIQEDYELEKKNYGRIKELYEKEVYSRNELERAMQAMSRKKKIFIEAGNLLSKQKFALEATRAKIRRAQSQLKQAELNIQRTDICSPIDGRVKNCSIEIGEYLNVGSLVCTVVNDKQPSLKVPVNADDALKILGVRPDSRDWLKAPDGMHVSVQWLRYPEECRWDAKIARIEYYERETDTLKILVVPAGYSGCNPEPFPLLPGMYCRVVFFGKPLNGVFKIPFSALQFNDYVFTVDKKGILHRNKVDLYSVDGDKVIILKGLPEGQDVVIQQLPRGLVDGMKVETVVEKQADTDNSGTNSAEGN